MNLPKDCDIITENFVRLEPHFDRHVKVTRVFLNRYTLVKKILHDVVKKGIVFKD